ncbi:hypothetical protein [Streptomyces sp. NPDC050560]|uniref:hypothetical protein n=1 Tax=Streptomyces sp. NPDC050560 TaxID=3365630 RepID=UPI0037BDD7C4
MPWLPAARARWHGRRDSAGLRAFLAQTAGGTPEDDTLPPYVLGLRMRARRRTVRLRTRTLARHRALLVRIQAESVRVVAQYTLRGEPAPAALARYGQMVGEWRAAATVCRQRAQQHLDATNQLTACYWDAAWAGARRDDDVSGARPTGRLPGEAVLDHTWTHLDDALVSDRWYAEDGPRRGADTSAVADALHILDQQSAHGGPGRARGRDTASGARRG